MKRRSIRFGALVAAGALVLAACGGDSDDATDAPETTVPAVDETEDTTEDTTEETTEVVSDAWVVDIDDCVDPALATAPIEGTVRIASAMPLTGGVAAAAFAPVKDGFEAFIKYANENDLLPGYTIEVSVADDQYDAQLTPGAVTTEIDAGADLFAGIIGTPNNAVVQDTLNDNCIPQLNALTGSPQWGDVANYPWTTGFLPRYDAEAAIYAQHIADTLGDGATVGLFTVSNEFGEVYAEAFREAAEEFGLDIVVEQTIEATDSNPPTSQITTIAAAKPDAIMAVPLGAGCIGFLTEVANTKAQNADWDPPVYLTNTCAADLILGAAGPAADGLLTTGYIADILDPGQQTAAITAYREYMAANGLAEIETTGAAGWTTAEATVAILIQAAQSPEGLTRQSIIEAARDFEYVPSLGRPGLVFKSKGANDPFLIESMAIIQYDANDRIFVDVSELITQYES